MGILNSELNYDLVLKDLGTCCLGEDVCNHCADNECLMKYAKTCITKCFKEGVTFVENGTENLPVMDTKIYCNENLIQGIGHILKQCKSCSEQHFDNCIINIIRNCYEIAIFGEAQTYQGSAFRYLNQIHQTHPDEAAEIIEAFHHSES